MGPLHGGANQAVIEMLEAIRAEGSPLQSWIDRAKDKTDSFRLMGFDTVSTRTSIRAPASSRKLPTTFSHNWESTIRYWTSQSSSKKWR